MRYWRNRHFVRRARPVSRTTGTTGILPVASTFAYNDRSEVLSASIGTNLFTHAYDDIGNHLFFGDNATTNTFTHNQVNQMVGRGVLDAPPTTTFTYTPDGGLASDGTWSYAYGVEDQLVSVTSSSLTNGAIRVSNTYDYRRRRTSKTVQRLHVTSAPPPAPPSEEVWETVEKRTFVYDDWNLIHETISVIDGGTTNITEVQYFWGLDLSDSLQGAGGVGGLLAVSRNGQFYFPAYDNNGNITKYIDESGNIVAAYEYDDFGRTISQIGPLADFFRHRFSTKYYDAETGLYYYINRFYSLDWRIWLNRDPIEEEGGLGLYVFSNNNAISNIDALGRAVFLVLAGLDNNRNTFANQKSQMAKAMRVAYKSLAFLDSLPNRQYECLKNKHAVFFNGQLFFGTLDEYKKLVRHELKSRVNVRRDYRGSLSLVREMSSQMNKQWDYMVYFSHGGLGRKWGVQTILLFSDGTYEQHAALDEVSRNMTSHVGSKLVISCYQTWDGQGINPLHTESISHRFPKLKFVPSGTNAILSYTTHRIVKGVN